MNRFITLVLTGLLQVHASSQPVSEIDSLSLGVLTLDMESAALAVARTTFWHRLIPRVHFTASIGARNLVTFDPESGAQTILPQDAYRLTISWSISDIIDQSQHTAAQLKLARIGLERRMKVVQIEEQSSGAAERTQVLQSEIVLHEEELRLLERIVRFHEAGFQQGSTSYVTLARARIDVLNAKRSLLRLTRQLQELQ